MPISFDISPELDLIIYICTGIITGAEYFKIEDLARLDPRMGNKTKTIIDCFSAELDLLMDDLFVVVRRNREVRQKGREVGKVAVLTRSTSLKFLGDTL